MFNVHRCDIVNFLLFYHKSIVLAMLLNVKSSINNDQKFLTFVGHGNINFVSANKGRYTISNLPCREVFRLSQISQYMALALMMIQQNAAVLTYLSCLYGCFRSTLSVPRRIPLISPNCTRPIYLPYRFIFENEIIVSSKRKDGDTSPFRCAKEKASG